MENDVEHLGNDLGIGEESSSSSSSHKSSDDESSSSNYASESSKDCTVLTPKDDRLRKRTYQATSLDSFFIKQPKITSSSSPSTTAVTDEVTSSKLVKQ
jgi:hypothetical protein